MKPVFLFINIPTIYWFITIYTYNLLIYLTYKYFQKGFQKGSDSLPCSQKVALCVRYIIKPKRAWNHVALLSGNWLHTSRNPGGSGTVGVRTMGWLDAGHRDNSPHRASSGQLSLIPSPATCPANFVFLSIPRSWGPWHTTLPEPASLPPPWGRMPHCS